MSRVTLGVFGVLLVIILVLSGRASCANKDLLPFLGKWKGGFVAQEFVDKPDAFSLKRHGFDATLQLYRTQESFILRLESEQESVDVKGTWSHRGQELRLAIRSVEIDDMGGADVRDPNRPFTAPEAIRKVYAGTMILRLSKDKKRLVGLPVTLDKVVGSHQFAKDSPG